MFKTIVYVHNYTMYQMEYHDSIAGHGLSDDLSLSYVFVISDTDVSSIHTIETLFEGNPGSATEPHYKLIANDTYSADFKFEKKDITETVGQGTVVLSPSGLTIDRGDLPEQNIAMTVNYDNVEHVQHSNGNVCFIPYNVLNNNIIYVRFESRT